MTIHLLAPGSANAAEAARAAAGRLSLERIAMVFCSGTEQVVAIAEQVARLLDVPCRVDPELAGLDVATMGTGAIVSRGGARALDGIADEFRGEHVLVVGDVPAEGAAPGPVLKRLEIGDDGWGPVTTS